MNRFLSELILVPALAGLLLATPLMAQDEPDQASADGLKLVEKDRRSEIYANPDVDWGTYKQVQLLEAPVSFRRNWQRDQNRNNAFKVDAKDMEKIRKSLSELFGQVMTEELTRNGGYIMAASAGDEVMTIKPSIVDLDVAAPDTLKAGRTKQYTDSSGRMTARLEVYDSVTGDLIATVSKRLEDPRRGYMQWTTSASNRADAERLLRQWARDLRERLDKASSHSPPPAESSDG
jgi:hypothetical protein